MSGSHRVDVIEKPKKQEWAYFLSIFPKRNFQDGNLDIGSSFLEVVIGGIGGSRERCRRSNTWPFRSVVPGVLENDTQFTLELF